MTTVLELLRDYDTSLGVSTPRPVVPDPGRLLSARLPAAGLALGAVAAVEGAVNRLRESIGFDAEPVTVQPDRVAASCSGDRMLRVAGAPVDGFAELSGFFGTADGWVRTHANYPHHRARLLAALGLPAGIDGADFARHVTTRTAQEIEDLAAGSAAIAVRVRDEHEWKASAHGRSLQQAPLIAVRRGAPPSATAEHAGEPTTQRPLAGVRVLDLTRVIAGPVATRTLALLGADVLRIDPVDLPEIINQHLDTGQGKRTARLDLRDPTGLGTAQRLLERADVLVTGYRPGALERLGLRAPTQRTGLIRAQVSAWAPSMPWARRRGFDSIVQAASGIAMVEGDQRPGALPAQVLDHASGYLLAAAVVDAVTTRGQDGRGSEVAVSLATTASWLLARPDRQSTPPRAELPAPETTTTTHRGVTTARPALAGYTDYPAPARDWGSDEPRWS